MKKVVYSTLLFSLLPLSIVHGYTFNQNLSIGSTGQDVFELQKFLNSNPTTQIALEGPGSPGNETMYFGEKTKQAVIQFQNLYPEQILIPNGLTSGTGFIGQSSRVFLNSIQTQITTSTTPDTAVTSPITQTPTTETSQYGFVVSPLVTQPDETLFIGSNTDISELTFIVGQTTVSPKCYTDFTCEIRIPKNITTGTVAITTSDPRFGTQNIQIINSTEKKPEVSIKKLSLTTENLITGKNFAPQMNVFTPYGLFETQTSNNSFILEFPKTISIATSTNFFFLQNKDGLESDILMITYEK